MLIFSELQVDKQVKKIEQLKCHEFIDEELQQISFSVLASVFKMAETLRLCLYAGVSGIFEPKKKYLSEVNSDGPKYVGPLGPSFNLLVRAIFGRNKFNYTSIVGNSTEQFDSSSGFYTQGSCMYSMQMNESDFSTTFVSHPLMASNLKQLQPFVSDKLYLFSRYNVSTQIYAADFVKALATVFTVELWMLISLFILMFWVLIKLNVKLVGKFVHRKHKVTKDHLYRVMAQVFNDDYITTETLSMKVSSIFLTLFSFYFVTYLSLLINTDIIVVAEPSIINTYDDLLAKARIKILFMPMFDSFNPFEFADPGSKEGQIWKRSLESVGQDRSKMVIRYSGSKAGKLLEVAQDVSFDSTVDTVAIVSEFNKFSAKFGGCIIKVMIVHKRLLDRNRASALNFYGWLAKDPASQEYILSLAHSTQNKSPYLKQVTTRLAWASNLGLPGMFLYNLKQQPVDLIRIENSEEGDTYRGCLSENYRENMPQVSCAAFQPVQFKVLSYIFAGLMATGMYCFLCEIHYKRKAKCFKLKKRRLLMEIFGMDR